jgi:anti-sigma factor RsiW
VTTEPLTCREFVELATEYLEEAMPPDERRRFEEHLAICPGCDTYLEQFRQTIDLTGRLSEDSIEPEAQETLLAAFRRWKEGRNVSGGSEA